MIRLALVFLAAFHPVMMRAGGPPRGVCKFKVSQGRSKAKVVGPEEIVDRVVHLIQDDSPVQILKADFGETILDVGGDRFYFADGYNVTVQNRSDRPVLNLKVLVHVRSRDGGAGGGIIWNGQLSPGQIKTLRNQTGHAYGGAPEDGVEILLGIDSVQFSDCEYSPSQGLASWR